ncbi:MAG: EamA/RhaT family transporter [Hyphomonadaceae bacterium]|nr:MAG: drug/metabolite exporter family transporter [Caulobacteraceae bacterium]MBT9446412.1 EamA/RhaT family transporter [Hyphomonadaceae bacterium]
MPLTFIWIPIVVLAAGLQTARNAVQRGLLEEAGPWGATLVRFLFGLPFAAVWYAGWEAATPRADAQMDAAFFFACAVGAAAQTIATASLLVAMRRSSFAVGSIFSQARLPLAAVIGFVMGDDLSPFVWIGVCVATLGLVLLSWPKDARFGKGDWSAAGFGFAAGALFALSANAFRAASLESAPGAPWLGAAVTLVVVQGMQAGVLSAWLAWRDRPALMAGLKAWRRSIGAGFTGFAASALWFTAFGMAPAAAVNAVGVSEIPIAAWAGRRLFREKLTLRQILAASLTAAGVVACALGSL